MYISLPVCDLIRQKCNKFQPKTKHSLNSANIAQQIKLTKQILFWTKWKMIQYHLHDTYGHVRVSQHRQEVLVPIVFYKISLAWLQKKERGREKAGGRVGECKREGIEGVTKMKQTPYWQLTTVSTNFAAWYKLLTSEFSLNKTITYSSKENLTAAHETLHW